MCSSRERSRADGLFWHGNQSVLDYQCPPQELWSIKGIVISLSWSPFCLYSFLSPSLLPLSISLSFSPPFSLFFLSVPFLATTPVSLPLSSPPVSCWVCGWDQAAQQLCSFPPFCTLTKRTSPAWSWHWSSELRDGEMDSIWVHNVIPETLPWLTPNPTLHTDF